MKNILIITAVLFAFGCTPTVDSNPSASPSPSATPSPSPSV